MFVFDRFNCIIQIFVGDMAYYIFEIVCSLLDAFRGVHPATYLYKYNNIQGLPDSLKYGLWCRTRSSLNPTEWRVFHNSPYNPHVIYLTGFLINMEIEVDEHLLQR